MWPLSRSRMRQLLQCYDMRFLQTSMTSKPAQQLTSLADFASGKGRRVPSQVRHMRSERSSSPARTAAVSDGSSPKQRLLDGSASRSASSIAQEEEDLGATPLAPEYQRIVTGRVDLASVAAALTLLGRDSYFWQQEQDGGQQPAAQQSVSGVPALRPAPLLLKAEQEAEQGRWYDSWEPAADRGLHVSSSGSMVALAEAACEGDAVAVKDERRARYARSRGLSWPPAFPLPRREHFARRANQAASLDAAIDAHCSAPQAAAVSLISGSSSGAAGSAGEPSAAVRVAMPKQGDEVELVCQSLAFGGKVCWPILCPCMLPMRTQRLASAWPPLPFHDQHMELPSCRACASWRA